VTNCTVSGNVTAGSGGGIRNDGTVTVTNSTFTGNIAGSGGGGIVSASGTAMVTNSTFSGNSALGPGGGIYNALHGTLTVTSSTFSGNSASNGGGISNHGESTVTLTNTIVAASPSGGDLYGGFGGTNNLIDDNGDAPSGSNNITNMPARLGPLADNGGPTQTMTLLPGSPALDAGATVGSGPAGNPVPATDQRGVPCPQGSGVDIGAVEVVAGYATVVNNTADGAANRFNCIVGNAGVCRLRDAIEVVNQGLAPASPTPAITFAVGGTILLNSGTLALGKDATIDGTGHGVIVDGGYTGGTTGATVFAVNGG
jgi:hypothetical protein